MSEENSDLRVAVVGVGMMGADHVRRLQTRTAGARVVVVADAFAATAEKVAAVWPGVSVASDPLAAIDDDGVDAVVIATPGTTHEELVLACLERARPVLCEKPLTTDVESSLRLVEAERATGRRLVQVGFMRRFDPEYAALRWWAWASTSATTPSCAPASSPRTRTRTRTRTRMPRPSPGTSSLATPAERAVRAANAVIRRGDRRDPASGAP